MTQFCDNKNQCAINEYCKYVEIESENIGICCLNTILNKNDETIFSSISSRHNKIGICPLKLTHSLTTNNILNLKQNVFFDQKG